MKFTESAPGPIGCATQTGIVAGATLAEVRQKVTAACRRDAACTNSAGACWQSLPEQPGDIYLAVVLLPLCTQPSKIDVAASPTTIYFAEWVGRPQGVCDMMLALPPFRLFIVPRSALHAGTFTVELQVQTEDRGTSTVDTQVVLS